MKRLGIVGALLFALVLLGAAVVGAQPQMGGQQERPSGPPPTMGRGMMGMPMMGMMCPMMPQMMGGQMDPMGMMGMMSGGQMDPKAMARMLQLRAEMLKAMGEVMLKHGKALEEGK